MVVVGGWVVVAVVEVLVVARAALTRSEHLCVYVCVRARFASARIDCDLLGRVTGMVKEFILKYYNEYM